MEDGGFAGFKAIHHGLRLFFCLIQLVKQAFNAVNNSLLLSKGSKRNFCHICVYYGVSINSCSRCHVMDLLIHKHTFIQVKNKSWNK